MNEEMRRQLIEVEEERREMADKYVALKSDLAALQRAHDAEVSFRQPIRLFNLLYSAHQTSFIRILLHIFSNMTFTVLS